MAARGYQRAAKLRIIRRELNTLRPHLARERPTTPRFTSLDTYNLVYRCMTGHARTFMSPYGYHNRREQLG